MRVLFGLLTVGGALVAEAVYQRQQERARLAAQALHRFLAVNAEGIRALGVAMKQMGVTMAEAGAAMAGLAAAIRDGLRVLPWPDKQTSRGEELRALDEVLEEHRLRIRRLGGFES